MKNTYDVIVIGAGLGGLICANYLTGAGLRVLVLEQHNSPGGCCSSFKREQFTFESGAHSLSGFGKNGGFLRIIDELGLKELKIQKAIPSDIIVTPDVRITLKTNLDENIGEFAREFPAERDRITKFLLKIENCDSQSALTLKNYIQEYASVSYRDLLNKSLHDERLKDIFCVFLANVGLPSHKVSALRALIVMRDFVMGGGYFVQGGMHNLVETLSEKIQKLGGDVKYSSKVSGIVLNRGGVQGVTVESGEYFVSRRVVSNVSLSQTFKDFIQEENVSLCSGLSKLRKAIKRFEPSTSIFAMYLGIKKMGGEDKLRPMARTVWYLPTYEADDVYSDVYRGVVDEDVRTFLAVSPSLFDNSLAPEGFECINLECLSSFSNQKFWKNNKHLISERLIEKTTNLIPNLRERIVISEIATPMTIQRYTLNDKGAIYGLASTIKQQASSVMPQKTIIPGLYLASHWATVGTGQGGTQTSAYAGRRAAQLVLASLQKTQRIGK